MKYGVVVFPGSNCDHDAFYAVSGNAGYDVEYLWHKDSSIPSDIDCIILPGGFSYGDYLRCGAIARFSPVMNEVIKFADSGKYVIGICNGFQILTESGLLPGTLLKNNNLKFICKDVYLKVENNNTDFTHQYSEFQIIRIPIAHGEGNYFAETDVINKLEDNNQVIFRYSSPDGEINMENNPNGSINNIAGIISKNGNVLGMMPHPERYSDNLLGCNDGIDIFNSIAKNLI
ncbi:MAG: phosphoribosylformylglycinamidine synthase subunit PurQ [Candidatus Kapabacteria bacterium]|nr:phosphoribosylformylglycinamidine synthase subunit PurQ [Ignavibacteriota bacterium]MCW5885684.1 phosphoribosylformylglycinamidine synthase subunit PurQ [Candidatus Kapabacteria bacterium]